jgi:hypothetical protein
MEISVTENVINCTKFYSSTLILVSLMCNGRGRRIINYPMKHLFNLCGIFVRKISRLQYFCVCSE